MSMTIKQAFQKLTADLSSGLRNPFFVGRILHQDFAEIAEEIEGGGGGGSTVVVTPVVTEGTKIATITVDSDDSDLYAPNVSVVQTLTEGTKIGSVAGTDLYAPAGGDALHVYSTTAKKVGTWTNGKDVMEKTYVISGTVANNGYNHFDNYFSGKALDMWYVVACSFSKTTSGNLMNSLAGKVLEIGVAQSVGGTIDNHVGADVNNIHFTVQYVLH